MCQRKGLEFTSLDIEGPLIIKPKVFGDHRGYFYESFREDFFSAEGLPTHFVQDNQSMSNSGILRGLHFQAPPFAQGKLVRVITGAVLDVVVDIRQSSPTYGQSAIVELNSRNHWMFWIPEGFAHGFYTLEDHTVFCYKCTSVYKVESENGLMWNDPDLNINWGVDHPVLSEKDQKYQPFRAFKSPFV